ncbi:hypothetical protein ACMHYB_02045 [Sorangium sp. So ce1128]
MAACAPKTYPRRRRLRSAAARSASRATAAGRDAVEGLAHAEVRGEVFAAFFFARPAGLLREDLLAELIGDPDPGEGAGP